MLFVQVKLWYTNSYQFRLGSLLTISTRHISSMPSSNTNGTQPSTSPTTIFTSIFPERDTGCNIEDCVDTASRTPICYLNDQNLMGLMTLEAFTGSVRDELPDAKVLVCVVAVGEPEACMLNHPLRPRTEPRNMSSRESSVRVAEDCVGGLDLSCST
jgi:hypothetical protein